MQGYAESPDGRSGWTDRWVVFGAQEKVFDFCVLEAAPRYETVFARVDLTGSGIADAGL